MTTRRIGSPLRTALAAAGLALAAAVPTLAADPPAKIALTGGRIITMAGEAIENGTVVVEYGRITAVGSGDDVDVPYDATEYDVSGKVVFPGMIDVHSSRGLDVANETLSVAPFLDVYDAIDPSRSYFENALRDGVTTVHVIQGNNTVIGGVSRIVRPIGLSVDQMTVETDIALKMSTTPKSGYDRMRQMSEMRETFTELGDYTERLPEGVYERWLKDKGEDIKVGPAEARRRGANLVTDDDFDDAHRNLMRLKRGDLWAWIHAGSAMDVGPAISVARDHEFIDRTVLVLGPTAHRAIEELKGARRPVIAPTTMTYRERDPMTGDVDETFIPLELYRAGLEFSLQPSASTSLAERYLNYQAAVCVRNGVPRRAALRAITVNPARAIGMEEDLGSIEVGKLGNLVVFSGDPLDFTTWVEHVFIDGVHAYNRATDPRMAELMKSMTADPAEGEGDMDAEAGDGDEADAGDDTDGEDG